MSFMIVYSGATLPQFYTAEQKLCEVKRKPSPVNERLFQSRKTALKKLQKIKSDKLLINTENKAIYYPTQFHNLLGLYINYYHKTLVACASNTASVAQKHHIRSNNKTVLTISRILDSVKWPRDHDDSPFQTTSTNLATVCKSATPSYTSSRYNYVGYVDMFIIPEEKLSTLGAIFPLDEHARLTFLAKKPSKLKDKVIFPIQLPCEFFAQRVGIKGSWKKEHVFDEISKIFSPTIARYIKDREIISYPLSIHITTSYWQEPVEYANFVKSLLMVEVKYLLNLLEKNKRPNSLSSTLESFSNNLSDEESDIIEVKTPKIEIPTLYAIEILGRNPNFNHIPILLLGELPRNNPDFSVAFDRAITHPNLFISE